MNYNKKFTQHVFNNLSVFTKQNFTTKYNENSIIIKCPFSLGIISFKENKIIADTLCGCKINVDNKYLIDAIAFIIEEFSIITDREKYLNTIDILYMEKNKLGF